MSWTAPARGALWCFVVCLAASCVGCPELNQGPGPGYMSNPFPETSIQRKRAEQIAENKKFTAPESESNQDRLTDADNLKQIASLQK